MMTSKRHSKLKLARYMAKKLWIFFTGTVYHRAVKITTKGVFVSRQRTRRIITFLILTGLTLSCLHAGGKSEPVEASKELTVWDFKYNDTKTRRVFDKVDDLFRKAHPDVDLKHVGFDEEEYIPTLRAALLAGTGPDVIWLHQGTEMIEYQSYLEVLDTHLADSGILFRADSLDANRNEEGQLKALPLSFQGMGWYYNKELFTKAGLDPENPPADWESFMEACAVLLEQGITPIASGNNRPLTTDFIRRSLITAFYTDEEIADFYRQGRGFGSPEFELIMQFCLDVRNLEYLNPNGIFQPYFNYAIDTFSSGEAAFIPGLLSDISHWKQFSEALGRDNVGYFPNLIHEDMDRPGVQLLQSAGILVGVNNESESKGLAYAYLDNLFSDRAQTYLIGELGMLMPLENMQLPKEDYPVLVHIEQALTNTGYDIEQFTPSTYIRDVMYRYDNLLINTREITLPQYILRLNDLLRFF